jgi:hypothetical protein
MRRTWPVLLVGALLMMVLYLSPVDGAHASIDMEDDEFYISVDPSDPDLGMLEITGTIDGNIPNIRDQLTVTISVNITEEHDGDPTGRFWAASAEFDDETVTLEETRLTFNQDSADFTIFIDPNLADGQNGDISVPTGISPLTVGELVLTLSYSGSESGEDIETATINPEYYHLINLTANTEPVPFKAGNMLNTSIRVKNSGNEVDSVTVEIPILEDLQDDGWIISLSEDRFIDMEPGQVERTFLVLYAPKEIFGDRDLDLKIQAYTDILDPDTIEPASSDELTIVLELKKSKSSDPIIVDDDDDVVDDDVIDDDLTVNPESSPYAVIGIIIFMAILAAIVIIVLFVKRGGGDDEEGDDDMHASMVRI